jgi:threonine synthase
VSCDCGGPLGLDLVPPVARPEGTAPTFPQRALPVSADALARVRLGSGETPLLRWRGDADVWLKCDHLQPTGSFKDRGAEIMTALALDLAATHVVVDSSGNAGAALAAHAAHAGLDCTVFAPRSTSSGKLRQIRFYGAGLELVNGPRESAEEAALAFAASTGALYASHAANPFFLEGTKGWIYEVVGELGDVDTIVLPVGSGSLLLGVVRGLRELVAAGWIRTMPHIVAAQAAGFATLATGFAASAPTSAPFAEGIAISRPVRGREMRDLVARWDMTVVAVDDEAVAEAQRELARQGYYVEPTGAAAWAAQQRLRPEGRSVVALTGNGLKSQSGIHHDHRATVLPESWRNDAAS